MVTKELIHRKERFISGESDALLIRNATELIISCPVYRTIEPIRFSIHTSTESDGRYIEVANDIVNEGGFIKSLHNFADFVKIQYDLGKNGEAEFAGYVIIKKIENGGNSL